MSGFTKLFSCIVTSSIWVQDDAVLRVWIAMLATSDMTGRVEGTIPGFASLCRIAPEEMERVISILEAPDRYSRTKDNEGRRVETIDGGWKILNYAAYRDKGQAKEGSRAPYMRSRREAAKGNTLQPDVTRYTEAEAEAEAEDVVVGVCSPPSEGEKQAPPSNDEGSATSVTPVTPAKVAEEWNTLMRSISREDLLAVEVRPDGRHRIPAKFMGTLRTRLEDPAWYGLYISALRHVRSVAWFHDASQSGKFSFATLLQPGKAAEYAGKWASAQEVSPAATRKKGTPTPPTLNALSAEEQARLEKLRARRAAKKGPANE